MKKILPLVAILSALFAVAASAARADTSFSIVGVGSTTGRAASPLGYGAGALLGLGLAGPLDVETGILLYGRDTEVSDPLLGYTFTSRRKAAQVPALLRLSFFPGLSVGAGGYASFASHSYEVAAPGGGSVSAGSGWRKDDYGLLASASLSLPVLPGCHLLFDARYAHGLGSFGAVAGNARREVQGLVGLQFVL